MCTSRTRVRPRRARADDLADQIAVCAARIDAATHHLLQLIRAFDAEKVWARQGVKSTAEWLSWRLGLGSCAAREKVRVANALGSLPLIDGALERGELSYSKVRAITRVATPDSEELLLAQARGTTGAELERICAGFRRVVRGRATDEDNRYVRRRTCHDGSVRIELRLLPDEADLVWKAIAAARDALGTHGATAAHSSAAHDAAEDGAAEHAAAEHATAEHGAADHGSPQNASAEFGEADATTRMARPSMADGVVALAEGSLAAAATRSGRPGGGRHTLFVHLSERDLNGHGVDPVPLAPPEGVDLRHTRPWKAELFDGVALAGETLLRIACDSGLVAAKMDAAGTVLDLGRRRRTVSPALRRALLLRDRGCRFPGCGHRAFVDAHHIEHWAHGGATDLENTVLLCHRHHVALHEGGFRLERRAGALCFLDPEGHVIPHTPPALPSAGGLASLESDQAARGISIDRRTGLPRRAALSIRGRPEIAGCIRALVRRHDAATSRPHD
jgi:hypothetical protein